MFDNTPFTLASLLLGLPLAAMGCTRGPKNTAGPNGSSAPATSAQPAPAAAPPQLTADLRRRATDAVIAKSDWKRGEFQLAWASEWDHGVVPVLMANPTVNRPYSIPIAVMGPNLVTPFDPDPLARIVRYRKPQPGQPHDAAAFAQLALWFGNFGAPVGDLITTVPVSMRDKVDVPQAQTAPRWTDDDTIEFYSMDFEMNTVYHDKVRFTPAAVKLSTQALND